MSSEAFERIAGAAPEPPANSAQNNDGWLDAFLAAHNIPVKAPMPYKGGRKWQLEACPFNPDHTEKDAVVYETADGAFVFTCSHNSCSDRRWAEFREYYDPGKKWRLNGRPVLDAKRADGIPLRLPGNNQDTPILVNGRPMHDMTTDVWAAIEATNRPLRIATHAGRLVRVTGDELEHLSQKSMRYEMDRRASFARATKDKETGEMKMVEASPPPLFLVDDAMAEPRPPVPHIRGIARHPFFGKDGALVSRSGFDAPSGMLLCLPPALEGISVPAGPTDSDIDAARELLEEAVIDFPFAETSDRTAALAFMLTPLMRPFFDDITPLGVVTATVRGNGKGLLAQTIAWPSEGVETAVTTWAHDDDRMKRELFAKLLSGSSTIIIDNISGKMSNSKLEAILTAPSVTERLLGGDRVATVENRVNWLATGNNFVAGGDQPRRIAPIRLEPNEELPETRTDFLHPDLLGWVASHRRELVTAALTLCRAWFAAGSPEGRAMMASYVRWSRTVGGILEVAGYHDFLANRAVAMASIDEEMEALRDFVDLWLDRYGEEPTTAGNLFLIFESMEVKPFRVGGTEERARRTSFGMKLRGLQGRVVKRYRLSEAGQDVKTKVKLWELTPMAVPSGEKVPPNGIAPK